MRGLSFNAQRADEADADTLLKVDSCWAAATGLALVDLITASDFAAMHLHLALDAGEPGRVARGMALESAARQVDWPTRRSAARLMPRARALAARVGTPHAMAMEGLADSLTACGTGQWARALASSERTVAILRDECIGVTWEMTMAQNTLIWGLMYLGEIGEVSRRVPALLADANRRGNLYLATELRTRCNFVWLAADDPDGGEREVSDAIARWSQKGFHRQHYSAMLARLQTALYRGNPRAAWDEFTATEPALRRSMLLRVQAIRIETNYMRGRSALAVAAADPAARRMRAIARSQRRRIAAERMPWSTPIARLLQAGIAWVDGRRDAALTLLDEALGQFERADMRLYAAVTRRRLGALRDDDRGRALFDAAQAWMAAQNIRNPAALTRMLAPGFPDPDPTPHAAATAPFNGVR